MTSLDPSVLIGTAETVRALSATLAATPGSPRPLGCVLVSPGAVSLPAVRVIGGLKDLPELHGQHGFVTAIVSLPSSMSAEIAQVRSVLRSLQISERFVTPLNEILAGSSSRSTTNTRTPGAAVNTAELIGRTPHGIDRPLVQRAVEGRRVLITGAGGSIGSELARIVATLKPAQVVLMERAENALFEIDRQMTQRFPSVARRAVLHDVVDAERTLRLLVDLKPQIVFHAAAHKHVPLMEDHPAHAVDNNFFGTKSIADAAQAVRAERFVMISSDKAVNPSSVMGATKRLAEMYVQALHRQQSGRDGTRFCMVRFGNVLGSACSVLPIWSQQITDGGPVTVTDERMTRYFMTIHEAATLVIQAAAMSDRDKPAVYVLDMGEPVRILELAQRLVASHGYEAVVRRAGEAPGLPTTNTDRPAMEIKLSGIRPGEKLYEELAYAAEQLTPTAHPGINAWVGTGEENERFSAAQLVAELSAVRANPDKDAVLRVIGRFIPTIASSTRIERAAPNATRRAA